MRWLADAGRRAERFATVCTGAFLGAGAGLLDGRGVTTHWRSRRAAAPLPALSTVDADPIYIRDGESGRPPA